MLHTKTNEHTNWIIRRFFPKWIDFSLYSDSDIMKIQSIVNENPRKNLVIRQILKDSLLVNIFFAISDAFCLHFDDQITGNRRQWTELR